MSDPDAGGYQPTAACVSVTAWIGMDDWTLGAVCARFDAAAPEKYFTGSVEFTAPPEIVNADVYLSAGTHFYGSDPFRLTTGIAYVDSISLVPLEGSPAGGGAGSSIIWSPAPPTYP